MFCQPSRYSTANASSNSSTFGTPITFVARKEVDPTVGYGVVGHRMKLQCITCMKEYKDESLEELRCEDYLMNRKGKQTGKVTPMPTAFNNPNSRPFGTVSNVFGNTTPNTLFGTKANSLFPPVNTGGFNFGTNSGSPFGTLNQTPMFPGFGAPQNRFSFGNATQPQTFFNNTSTGSIFPQTATPAFTFSNPTSPFQPPNNPFQFPAVQQQPQLQFSTFQTQQPQFSPFQTQPQFPTPFAVQPNPCWSPQSPTNFAGSQPQAQPQFTQFGQPIMTPNQWNPWDPNQQSQGFNFGINPMNVSAPIYSNLRGPPLSTSTSTFLVPGTHNIPAQVFACTPYPELPPINCDPATFARHMSAAAAKLHPEHHNLNTPNGTFPRGPPVRSYASENTDYNLSHLIAPKNNPPPKVDKRIFTNGLLALGSYNDPRDRAQKSENNADEIRLFKATPWKTLDLSASGLKDLHSVDSNRRTFAGRDRYFRNNGNLLAEFSWSEDEMPMDTSGHPGCTHGHSPVLDLDEVDPEDELFEIPIGVRPRSSQTVNIQRSIFKDSKRKSGVILTKKKYYSKPNVTELDGMTDQNGDCFVENFTVGHSDWGSATFVGFINVANLNLDGLIEFSYKEFTVYPHSERLPRPGVGLNRSCVVTLLKVWPGNASANEKMRSAERLKRIGYQKCLQKACQRFQGEFIDYVPETGAWTFKVQSFPDLG